MNYKEIAKYNRESANKTCPNCGNILTPQCYGYNCLDCGAMLNDKLETAKSEDLF